MKKKFFNKLFFFFLIKRFLRTNLLFLINGVVQLTFFSDGEKIEFFSMFKRNAKFIYISQFIFSQINISLKIHCISLGFYIKQ